MANEETAVFVKDSTVKPVDSQFGGISIRAWLALIVIGTVCFVTLAACARAILIKDYQWTPDGQFWMLASGIMAHYFGTNKQTDTAKT